MSDFKQQLKAAYDLDSKERLALEGVRDEWKSVVRRELALVFRSKNVRNILELGSGVGTDAKFFQDSGFNVLATDFSNGMVKICKEKGLDTMNLDLYDIATLQKKFDAVYTLNTLLHVPKKDLDVVLSDIHNVLNPGGIFFYGVYGGKDEEQIRSDKGRVKLPRFFSFLSDDSLLRVVKDKFKIFEFKTIDTGSKIPWFHFQSLTLIK
ncbi:MAG: class I SAM-dependent methyltransferase [Patescibacteria group bacterium]|jgi:SAM-dependent methyltransferase